MNTPSGYSCGRGEQPQGEPGLADAARAAQGELPRLAQRQPQITQLPFPPDEAVRLPGR